MANDEPSNRSDFAADFGADSRSEFGADLTPPPDYDPFETGRRVERPTTAGPVEPMLLPSNNPRPPAGPTVKVPFWDRPKPKKDWYWFLGRLGGTLITLGVLMFLFVGYQLWGTGIEEAQSQNRLEQKFAEVAIVPSTTVAPPTSEPASTTDSTTPAPTTTLAPPVPVAVSEGDPIAVIDIPSIGVSKYVVEGVETPDLKTGPGHYSSTPFPGELGNAAIAGHRTTYGEPFRHLDDLAIGDEVRITDLLGRVFVYRVTEQKVVSPSDSWVVATTDQSKATLTLTTCHPEFSAKQRLIVTAELDLSVSAPAQYPAAVNASETSATPATTTSATTTPVTTTTIETTTVPSATATTIADTSVPVTTSPVTTSPEIVDTGDTRSGDGFERGWFSDPAAWPQFLLWTALELFIVWGAWQVAKKFRNRIIGAAVGFVPFFVVLYFVFQNVNRLLPPNL